MLVLDFDHMHGAWVTDTRFKGSYGRIAWRESKTTFWVKWERHQMGDKRSSGSCVDATDLFLLPVGSEPWFSPCHFCGEYGSISQQRRVRVMAESKKETT
jgi:hypothetical protein